MVVVGQGVGWGGHCLSKISGWVSSVILLAFVSSFVRRELRAKKLSNNSFGRVWGYSLCVYLAITIGLE